MTFHVLQVWGTVSFWAFIICLQNEKESLRVMGFNGLVDQIEI